MKHFLRAAFWQEAFCVGVALAWLLLAQETAAQSGSALAQPITARSHSGQFTVQGLPHNTPLSENLRRSTATNWVRLDPPFTAVSCERIREALLSRLDSDDRYRGRIFVRLRPVRRPTDGFLVTQTRFSDGWRYRLEMPDAVEPAKFVRAIVAVLLAERAHRNQSSLPAEVPAWLAEGLAQELLADRALDLIVRPPDALVDTLNLRRTSRQDRRTPTLSAAHAYFTDGRIPLTFDELSHPTPEMLTDEAAPSFYYSAQMFVHELLILRDGRVCLGTMLDLLGQAPDWQTAFLRAFPAHFTSRLDVGKWWEMKCLEYQERGILPTLWMAASLSKLAEALPVAVQHQSGTNTPGPRAILTLQTFLQQADEALQLELLPSKIEQLKFLPPRVTPEVSRLTLGYISALEDYRKEMASNAQASPAKRMNQFMLSKMLRKAVRQLNALDATRSQLAQVHTPPPGTPAPNKPIVLGQPAPSR